VHVPRQEEQQPTCQCDRYEALGDVLNHIGRSSVRLLVQPQLYGDRRRNRGRAISRRTRRPI
jgi:hypothetical protein